MMSQRPLTSAELRSLKARLAIWQTPHEMLETFRSAFRVAGKHLFRQSGLSELREAYLLAHFGNARRADRVRLRPGCRPDGEMLIRGSAILVEITEADEPDRKRGVEAKAALKGRSDEPIDALPRPAEAALRHDQILRAIQKRVRTKRAKHTRVPYPPCELAILLNMPLENPRVYRFPAAEPDHIASCLEALNRCAEGPFTAIYVITPSASLDEPPALWLGPYAAWMPPPPG